MLRCRWAPTPHFVWSLANLELRLTQMLLNPKGLPAERQISVAAAAAAAAAAANGMRTGSTIQL